MVKPKFLWWLFLWTGRRVYDVIALFAYLIDGVPRGFPWFIYQTSVSVMSIVHSRGVRFLHGLLFRVRVELNEDQRIFLHLYEGKLISPFLSHTGVYVEYTRDHLCHDGAVCQLSTVNSGHLVSCGLTPSYTSAGQGKCRVSE